jgi:hypothetical protein
MADTVANYSADDARSVFQSSMQQYGFSDLQIQKLLPQITEWQATYSPSQIVSDLLPTTDVYQERFSANTARVKAGLPALSPAAYINLESTYRSIMQDAGLPKGFYDNSNDFSSFISKDISPTEMKTRVDAASKAVNNTDPAYKQALQSMYGIDEGMMAAHMLDPERALPLIEKQAKAIQMGTAATRQGLNISATEAENLGMNNITGVSAEAGMQQVASMTPGLSALGNISGQGYDQSTAESEVFGGLASAQRKREQLINQEQNRFTGRSNVAPGSLNASNEGLL